MYGHVVTDLQEHGLLQFSATVACVPTYRPSSIGNAYLPRHPSPAVVGASLAKECRET